MMLASSAIGCRRSKRLSSFLDTLAAKNRLDPTGTPWTHESLLEALRDILVDELGNGRDRVTLQARIRRDLGIE